MWNPTLRLALRAGSLAKDAKDGAPGMLGDGLRNISFAFFVPKDVREARYVLQCLR